MIFSLCVAALVLGGGEPWTLDDVRARARPVAAEARLEAELAELRRELAAGGERLAEGPTIALTAGPRWRDDDTAPDAELEIDWPLAARGPARRAFAETLGWAGPALAEAARAEARLEIERAYVAAWAAGRRVALREQDLAVVTRWETLSRRRVEAGAEAPFEGELAGIERASAEATLVQARSERARAWAELRRRVDLPEVIGELAEPAAPDLGAETSQRLARSIPSRALAARRALEQARADFDLARARQRWALRTGAAREGEETVARLGAGYRLPLNGEREGALASARSLADAARLDFELASAELAARLAALENQIAEPPPPPVSPEVMSSLLAALEARLVEGKSPPAEMLVLRRGLLAARELALERRAAHLQALFELAALTAPAESSPAPRPEAQP